MTFRAPGTVRKNFAALEAVFRRIGINKQRGSAFPLGGERLEPAIAVGIRIAHENDFAFYADAVLPEELVIFWISAVRVDDFGGDLARSGITEVGAGDRGIFRIRISLVGIFAESIP